MPVLRKTGNNKAALRQTFERNGHFASTQQVLNFAIPPLMHKPTPDIPMMNFLQFELILLYYLIMAMVIQYVNIYKANLYVMDYHLLLFITIILLRRVGWLLLKQTLASEVMHSLAYWSKVAMKTLLLVCMFFFCFWSFYNVMQNSAIEDVLFLCYPFGVYLWTFGFTLNPYSHSVLFKLGTHQSEHVQDLVTNNTSLFHQAVTLQSVSLNTITSHSNRHKSKPSDTNGILSKKDIHKNNGHTIGNGMAKESDKCASSKCSMSPDIVRYEAECLRTDFNLRMKQILFNSLVSAYYVAFIPVKFNQNGWLYYDIWWATQHIIFVWLNTFILLMNFLVPHHYIDGLHKCAIHLGAWKKYKGQRETPHVWSPLTIWPQAALVRHSKGLFRATGRHNTAVPGDNHHARFYYIFKSPLRLLNWLVGLQLASVLYQFYVLTGSTYWYQCLSVLAMSVINYFLLFRLLRERWAVQATMEEHAICCNQG